MTWGLAEEAGKAARWLSGHGLPGVELLLRLLTANDGRAYDTLAPALGDDGWHAAGGYICPLCCGASISDRVGTMASGSVLSLNDVKLPIIIVPFLDHPARASRLGYGLSWPGARASVSERGLTLTLDDPCALEEEEPVDAELSVAEDEDTPPSHPPHLGPVTVEASTWAALDDLGKRTYVPASAESRDRGAGAGRTDND